MTRLGRPWPVVLAGSSLALALAVGLGTHSPVRAVLTIWFFLTCPGLAVVGLLDIEDSLGEMLLAVALSIAIGMLLAAGMLITHTWSPDGALAILVGLSLLGAAGQTWSAHRAGIRRGEKR